MDATETEAHKKKAAALLTDKSKMKDICKKIRQDKRFIGNIVKTIQDDANLEYKAQTIASGMETPTTVVAKSKAQIKEAKRIQVMQQMAKVQIPESNVICVIMNTNGKVASYDMPKADLESDTYILHPVMIGGVALAAVSKNALIAGRNWKRNKLAEYLVNSTARALEEPEGEVRGNIIFVKFDVTNEDPVLQDMDVSEFKDMLNEVAPKK